MDKLQGCSGIQMRGDRKPRRHCPAGFDCETGLETSALGSLTVTWSDPPIVLGEEPEPQVLLSIDDAKVFGLSKEKVQEMVEVSPRCKFQLASMFQLGLVQDLPGHKQALEHHFKQDQVPIHVGFQCAGCGRKPLIGARFACKTCAVHFCGACFKGRAHAHCPEHQFTVQTFPRTSHTAAPVASKITEGSKVVVIGTGKKHLDGKLGLVTALAPTSSSALPLCSVVLDGADDVVNLEAKHLFLRSSGQEVMVAAPHQAAEPCEPPAEPVVFVAKSVDPRFTLVRKASLRELRQAEGQQALERVKGQGPHTARKSTFQCKGNCGTRVEVDKQEYVKQGQLVLCEECTKKKEYSQKNATCRKCQNPFHYFQFLVDIGECVPTLCEECQEDLQWAIISR